MNRANRSSEADINERPPWLNQQIPPNPPTMFRISIASCNRISSAAGVLLPKNQGLCAARPAGIPPRRHGALLTHSIRINGPSGDKCDLHIRMQIELRRALHHCSAPRSTCPMLIAAGNAEDRHLPSHHQWQHNNHRGEFSHVNYFGASLLGRRFRQRTGMSLCGGDLPVKKASQRPRSGFIARLRRGMSGLSASLCSCVPEFPSNTGSMMALPSAE